MLVVRYCIQQMLPVHNENKEINGYTYAHLTTVISNHSTIQNLVTSMKLHWFQVTTLTQYGGQEYLI